MSEKLVKEALKKYLKSIGAYYFMPVQMGYGASSLDFFVCHHGKFYGIETKRQGLLMTLRQSVVASEIEAAGGKCWVDDDTALEVTRKFLR